MPRSCASPLAWLSDSAVIPSHPGVCVTDTTPTGLKRSDSGAPELVKPDAARRSCMVAGIGASAGGMEAFSALLEKLPADTGMTFVFLQHLDTHYPSLLAHLLSAKTAMSVTEVSDGVRVAPNHVYVVPPGADMLLKGGRLKLTPRVEKA